MSGTDPVPPAETPPAPAQSALAPGVRVTLRIEDIAFGGEGVGRADGLVVFVPFVVVGETVEAEITEARKSFARAKLLRVVEPSQLRATPRCAHFAACGGCQYQHMEYAEQLRVKRKQIVDLFERVGGFEGVEVRDVIPCPAPYGYRNRIMIRSQWNKPEQRLNIGFVRHDCGLVEDIFDCAIAEPELNAQIRHVRDNPPPRGGLKVVLRIAPEDWEVPNDSFFQNNFHQLPNLVATVRERIHDAGTRHLVDAYCGVGFFAIELAGAVESFAGVEYDAMAIRAARKNMAARAITNGEFVQGKTEEELGRLCAKFSPERTTVVIDPPRRGCMPGAIDMLREQRPAHVIYVSCHPATLARDLNLLCTDGVYALRQVTPVDMFPQTQHVECVADLRLVNAPPSS
jgi:tRNA/tmRNA/rRNA uracil-C5-methylase (TrmA/RlmC/RlmD family)